MRAPPKHAPHAVRGFALRLVGQPWEERVNHRTASRAKADFLLSVNDGGADWSFTQIRVRVLPELVDTDCLRRVRKSRNRPELLPGVRVRVGEDKALGVIVDGNYSGNFDVLFDDDAVMHRGRVLNVHPGDITLMEAAG